jgi:hypothetical protein
MDQLIGKTFKSHHSVEPIEYKVIAEDVRPGFYLVESASGMKRVMDARILKPLILQEKC